MNLKLQGDCVRRVLKRGSTNTTVGTLTKFMSFARQYFQTGNRDSREVAILSHEQGTGTFSKCGDSGSLIVSSLPMASFLPCSQAVTTRERTHPISPTQLPLSGSGISSRPSFLAPSCILTT